jgi:hypothetical protein
MQETMETNLVTDSLRRLPGTATCYNKIPKSEVEHQEREKSIEKWQQQWDNTTKGSATKEFFPDIKDRLKMKI